MDYRWTVTNTGRRNPGTRVPMVAQIPQRNVHVVKTMAPAQQSQGANQPSTSGQSSASHQQAPAHQSQPAGQVQQNSGNKSTSLLSAFPSNKLTPRERGFFLP